MLARVTAEVIRNLTTDVIIKIVLEEKQDQLEHLLRKKEVITSQINLLLLEINTLRGR